MKFDWYPPKNETNKRDHQLSFEVAVEAFLDPQAVTISTFREKDNEHRFKTIGRIDGKLYAVVWTPRDPFYWIISARRTDRREDKIYAEANPENHT